MVPEEVEPSQVRSTVLNKTYTVCVIANSVCMQVLLPTLQYVSTISVQNPVILQCHGLLFVVFRNCYSFWYVFFFRRSFGFGNCLTVVVERSNVFGSAMEQMGCLLGHVLREKSLHVTFKDEPGELTAFPKFFRLTLY